MGGMYTLLSQIPKMKSLWVSDWVIWVAMEYIPPMPVGLQEIRDRIVNAIALVHVTFLGKLWVELEYHLDACRITRCSNTEHL
jgi:hypothetical protein